MKTLVIVQARCGSTRLPGKVLRSVAGKPLLERMIERVLIARTEFSLVIATTTEPGDDPIRELATRLGVDCYSGHPTDLLDRHFQCAKERDTQIVVKIPSDCPLIDPNVIDLVLAAFLAKFPQYDYVSNLHPATFPDGNDVEVMKYSALDAAWREATKNFEREHTTPYLWERPERFVIGNVTMPAGGDYSVTHRWTIDYEEDYQFIQQVYLQLWKKTRPNFTMNDILNLLERRPDIAQLNARFAGVNWYRNHLHELKTIQPHDTRPGFAA